jgi:protein-disulfide isomerase
MASRTKQKEEARARRLAEEHARAEQARRTRRMQTLGGVLVAGIVVVVVAIVVSSSGGGSSALPPNSAAARQQASTVNSLLSGIPQSGVTLGSPSAPVTVTEFGDLQCPICRDFALGSEGQLISNEVKTGKVKLVYKSLETATGNSPDPSIFGTQQASAYAAGAQAKAWNYILVFYHSQGQEGTAYVNQSFLNGIAKSIPGLNFATWKSAAGNPTYTAQVQSDQQAAAGRGFNSTPTIVVTGPKGSAQPIVGDTDYGTLQSAIKQVS